MRTTGWVCAVAIAVVGVAAGAMISSGCDRGGGGAAASGKGRLIGATFQTMDNPFFVELDKGLREVVESKGDRLTTLDAQRDDNKQRGDISDLLNQGAALIFINPVNWEGIKGSLEQAQRKNVPCIVVDAPVEDRSLVLSTVASDNVEAGRLAARALAVIRPNAKLVVLHLSTNKACIDRVAGFKEEMAKHPGMTILDTQEGNGSTEHSRPVASDLIGRFPELDAIFTINDPSAMGAIAALKAAGKLDKVAVVSVDGSEEAIGSIAQGELVATSAQFPVEMGKAAAEQAYNHFEGRPVVKDVVVRVELIDKSNVDKFKKPG